MIVFGAILLIPYGAIIRCKNDKGVVFNPMPVQRLEYLADTVINLHRASSGELPDDMLDFLQLGDRAMAAAQTLLAAAQPDHSLDLWLCGPDGRARSGVRGGRSRDRSARRGPGGEPAFV